MASLIADTWVRATMAIENDWGEKGTGFLVARMYSDKYAGRIFLVSNKHVLNVDPSLRSQANAITLHYNMRQPDGSIEGASIAFPLVARDGSIMWREHPDPDVDVIAFDVTALIDRYQTQIDHKWIQYDLFVDAAKSKEYDISIADDVLVIGYPLGLRQGKSNSPLVRTGIIATRIGEPFVDEIEQGGQYRQRLIRGFLVDGATIPGSSGSPVVLKPIFGRAVHGRIAQKFLLRYCLVSFRRRNMPLFILEDGMSLRSLD